MPNENADYQLSDETPLGFVPSTYYVGKEKVTREELVARVHQGLYPPGSYKFEAPGVGEQEEYIPPKMELLPADNEIIMRFQQVLQSRKLEGLSALQSPISESVFLKHYTMDVLLTENFLQIPNIHQLFWSQPESAQILILKMLHKADCIHFLSTCFSLKSFFILAEALGSDLFTEQFVSDVIMALSDEEISAVFDFAKRKKIDLVKGMNYHKDDCGTMLHISLANERFDHALSLIKILRNPEYQFNFASQDSGEKTPLLIAALLGANNVVRELVNLTPARAIGLNTPDNQGRTPLMLAAALGRAEILQCLIDAEANLLALDNKGRSVHHYSMLPQQEVEEILLSIHVQPNRHFAAPHNWLYFNNEASFPLTFLNSDEKHRRVLISKDRKNWQMIQQVLKISRENPLSIQTYTAGFERELTYVENADNRTYIDFCLANQIKGRVIVNEALLRCHSALGNSAEVVDLIETHKTSINCQDRLLRSPLHACILRFALLQSWLGTYVKLPEDSESISEFNRKRQTVFSYLLTKGADLTQKNSRGNSVKDIVGRDLPANSAEDIRFYKDLGDKIEQKEQLPTLTNSFSKLMNPQGQQNKGEKVVRVNNDSSLSC